MMENSYALEAVAASLVREYLSRKGLKGTLQKMDEEYPRTELSISNRQALMKYLHLEKLMKKNKEEPEPLKAMLEVMTKHFAERKSMIHSARGDLNGQDTGMANSFHSNISFSPQANCPEDILATKPRPRPKTAAVITKRERASHDLVMDDDVEGECLVGEGMSGLISGVNSELPMPVTNKSQPVRPLSSRLRSGAIISNDESLSQKRRTSAVKTRSPANTKMSVSEQEQQRKLVSDVKDNDFPEETGRKNIVNSRVSSAPSPAPVSFEALLMKGEERANILQRIGLEKQEIVKAEKSYAIETSSMVGEQVQSRKKSLSGNSTQSNPSKVTELEFGDVDDLDADLGNLELQTPGIAMPPKSSKLTKIQSTPIDLKTAINLKTLVLGSPCQRYPDEWLLQAFSFCDIPNLKYGIVQKKGGPCGVLAAVQACVIQEIFFGDNKLPDTRYKNPSRSERSKLLALALSNIFWRAGDRSRAVVALPSETTHILSSTKFKQDEVTEKLSLYTFTNFDELSNFLIQSISQFETDGCPGVILVMYAAILSRKPYLVRGDFDVPENTMIASHGYCTQEVVNLVMSGRAVSNTFNDTVELDSGGNGGDTVILKGIQGRSDIGLLSLFEHYKSCQVGTYLKTPKYPIWVVCSESHFSVLFSTRRDLVSDWKAERRFDLIYYDGLARQQEEIKLTISTTNRSYKPPSSEDDLVPPLDHCIRTKWEDAEIDWNGYDPIL